MATQYKQINCRDGGAPCDFLVRAETEDEAVAVAAGHAKRFHDQDETPELRAAIKAIVKTVEVR